jgi:integrase
VRVQFLFLLWPSSISYSNLLICPEYSETYQSWICFYKKGELLCQGFKGVKTPALHAFRRQFALSCLRSGMNVYYLQTLMGHSDLQVLNRYLKQTTKDVSDAHRQAGPVDNSL